MRDEYDFSDAKPNPYADRLRRPLSTPTTRAASAQFQMYRDSENLYHWRLVDADGRVLSTSAEAFPSAEACRSAIDRTRAVSAVAPVATPAA